MAERTRLINGSSNLKYPSDLGSAKSNYYVLFEINVQEKSQIEFGSTAYSTTPGGSSSESSTVAVPRAPTRRLAGTIALYMPASLELTHKANYAEAEIGAIAAGSLGALKMITGEGFSTAGIGDAIKNEAARGVFGALEQAGVTGAKAASEIQRGVVTNNRAEMKFEGIDRRAFSYTFKMLPKDPAEAQAIENIVRTFRYHSMPEISGASGAGRTMIIPSTFNITYKPDIHLHKVGECVLETVSVKYGGERPQFFRDHQPVETELTLQFKELDLVTKRKIINDGF